MMMYLVLKKPFSTKAYNMLEIFNESCILLTAYGSFLFTDYVPEPDI